MAKQVVKHKIDMGNLELKKGYQLSQIIEIIKSNLEKNGFSNADFELYTKEYVKNAHPNLICYLDIGPTITDDDDEIYPDFVRDNSLEFYFYGQQFEDVISSVLDQKKNPTVGEFVSALNYYTENDAFLDFE